MYGIAHGVICKYAQFLAAVVTFRKIYIPSTRSYCQGSGACIDYSYILHVCCTQCKLICCKKLSN